MTTRKSSEFVLRANAGQYKAEMGAAKKSTKDVSDSQVKLSKSANDSGSSLEGFGKTIDIGRARLDRFGKAALLAGTALTTGIIQKGLTSGS